MRRFTMQLRATRMLHSYVGVARKVQRYTRTWSAYGELRGVVGAAWHYRLYVQYIQGVPELKRQILDGYKRHIEKSILPINPINKTNKGTS